MRYVVAEGAIGTNGRTVRCANCGHQWHEDAEVGLDEELFSENPPPFLEEDEGGADDFASSAASSLLDDEEEEQDFQSILRKEIEDAPIPVGVHPVQQEEDLVLAQLGKKPQKKKSVEEKVSGYMLAGALWLVMLGVLFLLQPQISRAWPPSNLLYSLAGMKPVPPGEGLALESLHAEMKGNEVRLTGEIINLKDKELKVPAIMAIITGEGSQKLDEVLIAPLISRLKPEGRVAFDVTYPKLPAGAKDVSFAFSFVKAKAAKPAPDEASHEEPVHEEKPKEEDH